MSFWIKLNRNLCVWLSVAMETILAEKECFEDLPITWGLGFPSPSPFHGGMQQWQKGNRSPCSPPFRSSWPNSWNIFDSCDVFFCQTWTEMLLQIQEESQVDFDKNAHLILPHLTSSASLPQKRNGWQSGNWSSLFLPKTLLCVLCYTTCVPITRVGSSLRCPSSECELDSNGTDFPWPLPTNPPISISFHFLAQKSASRDHCDCNGSIFPRSSLSPAGLYFVFNLSFTDIWRWKCCDLSRPKLKLASHASDHEQCCQSSI